MTVGRTCGGLPYQFDFVRIAEGFDDIAGAIAPSIPSLCAKPLVAKMH
jgi:hypothetical protein